MNVWALKNFENLENDWYVKKSDISLNVVLIELSNNLSNKRVTINWEKNVVSCRDIFF